MFGHSHTEGNTEAAAIALEASADRDFLDSTFTATGPNPLWEITKLTYAVVLFFKELIADKFISTISIVSDFSNHSNNVITIGIKHEIIKTVRLQVKDFVTLFNITVCIEQTVCFRGPRMHVELMEAIHGPTRRMGGLSQVFNYDWLYFAMHQSSIISFPIIVVVEIALP